MAHAFSDPRQPGAEQLPRSAQRAGELDQHAERLSLQDVFGDERQGFILRMARWSDSAAAELQRASGDFHIVILNEPPEEPIQAPPRTVVCAPTRPLEQPSAVQEAAVAYKVETQQSSPLLTAAEVTLLSQGKLYAPTELRITPEEAFSGDKPRLELLAQELLMSEALAGYLGPLAVALSAPDAPARGSPQALIAALRGLLRDAETALRGLDLDLGPEASDTLDRISQLSAAEDAQPFLASARRLYPRVPALLEEVYLLRALVERLPAALEVLAMRAFTADAIVPPTDSDLSLDKAIVTEQLQFASLIPEPQRLNTARTALDCFRDRYRSAYKARHRSYWDEMARLHSRLIEAEGHAEALTKLNTLTELGPPVGEAALAVYRELLEEASGCPLVERLVEEMGDGARCPACGLRLDQQPPAERASEILHRIERAIDRQLARLSSVGVRQVLERSGDPRIDQFLRVVHAAHLSSLVEVLDDDLVGYLRRFLVESRLSSLLQPILSRLEEGTTPKAEEAQETMREMARVLQRAFRASRRALPPAKAALKAGATKNTRR